MKEKKFYTLGEVTRLVGCPRQNIYHWEKEGKIPKAKRNPLSNYRLYTLDEIEQLKRLYNGRQ